MDQQHPPFIAGHAPLDNQQQPQWQPQAQQSMPGTHQAQPQYAQMPPEGAAMSIHEDNQSTAQLNAMYPQGSQIYEQTSQLGGPQYAQQGGFQQPQAPQQGFVQQFPYQNLQQEQHDMSMDPGAQGSHVSQAQYHQQQPIPPGAHQFGNTGQPAWSGSQAPQFADAGFDNNASAWEQQHVTEVNNQVPPTGFGQPANHATQQTQAMRDAELSNALQRVQALDAERENQDMLFAMAESARHAPDFAELEEQLQEQIYQAKLMSLDDMEQQIHVHSAQRSNAGQPNAMYGDGQYADSQFNAETAHRGPDFSDPRGGAPLYEPTPTMQGNHASQAPSMHGGQSQMQPPLGYPVHNPAGFAPMQNPATASGANLGFSSPTPRSQTPTRGVSFSDAARYREAEEAQRLAGFRRAQVPRDDASASTEYTINPGYNATEASTARQGSKGKGRQS